MKTDAYDFLRLRPWQLFLYLTTSLLLAGITRDGQYFLSVTLNVLGHALLFGWFLLLGTNLNELLGEGEKSSDTFFTANCFYIVVVGIFASVLNDGPETSEMSKYAMAITAYYGFAFFHVVYFVSKAYVRLQNKNAPPGLKRLDEVTVFLCFFIFVAGVWLFQPRIRMLLGNH